MTKKLTFCGHRFVSLRPIMDVTPYFSYLVRVWRVLLADQGSQWQGEVESIQTGEVWPFDGLDGALTLLRRETAVAVPATDPPPDKRSNSAS